MPPYYEPDALPPPPWRTKRLVLRPYTTSDVETAFAALDQHEQVWQWDPGYAPSKSQREQNISRYAMLRRQFGFGPCAAFLAAEDGTEGELVGQGGLNPYIFDHKDGSRTAEFEVMYKLSPPYWGYGYATEIAAFWVEFAFEQLKFARLCTSPGKANVRSIAVLERLGAQIEDDWLDDESVIAIIENPKGPFT